MYLKKWGNTTNVNENYIENTPKYDVMNYIFFPEYFRITFNTKRKY